MSAVAKSAPVRPLSELSLLSLENLVSPSVQHRDDPEGKMALCDRIQDELMRRYWLAEDGSDERFEISLKKGWISNYRWFWLGYKQGSEGV